MTDSQFSVAWNRVCKWRRHGNELWVYEAILCGRTLLNGRPTLKIAARLADHAGKLICRGTSACPIAPCAAGHRARTTFPKGRGAISIID